MTDTVTLDAIDCGRVHALQIDGRAAAVNCRNPDDLCRCITERVAALDAVRSLETTPVIRTLKRAATSLSFPH
ncbi:hypothetical protein ACWC2K_05795 [Streptomyces chattanoogensis]